MRKKIATVMVTVMMMLPASSSYAFSWAPLLDKMNYQQILMDFLKQYIVQVISEKQLGGLGKFGSVIGEIGRNNTAINDAFRGILATSLGSANPVLKDILMAGLGDLGDYNKILGDYINNKVLGAVNDTIDPTGMFKIKVGTDGKVGMDIAASVGKDKFSGDLLKILSDGVLTTTNVDMKFKEAENMRKEHLEKMRNATMERNKKLLESNETIMKRIEENMKKLEDNSKKSAEFQAKLLAMDVVASESGDAGKMIRQSFIEDMNKEVMTEADIAKVQAMIDADRAQLESNHAVIEVNNQNFKMVEDATKLQEEKDKETKRKAEGKVMAEESKKFWKNGRIGIFSTAKVDEFAKKHNIR